VAELLWGGEMFYEMYDDPDFVHAVMRLITDTYKSFMDTWYQIIPKRKELTVHWGILQRGTIFLRLDSGMNISPELYRAYSMPYDRELLDYYDGGCIHFCGRADHYMDVLCELDSLYAVQASQPHLNDMDKILSAICTRDKRILMLPNAAQYAEAHAAFPDMKNGVIHS
jgi:hypothetical protein